ncbi:MAG: hypothetical protein QM496_16285 [Verrucomicrobiota bacterium]
MSEPELNDKNSDPSVQLTDGESSSAKPVDPKEVDSPAELSAEEQMALYEKSLKEDDWGHQPC